MQGAWSGAHTAAAADGACGDAAGIPGFQFIQDPLQYDTRTHHSNQDVYEQVQPDDMKFNAAVVASFVWQTAQRSEKLPRKAPVPPRVTP